MQILKLKLSELTPNTGQIPGLPSNPRQWTKSDVDKIAKSLKETPELFEARPIIAVPYGGQYVILGGNLRYEGARKNKDKEAPVCVIPEGTPVEKMKEIVIKDNGSFGAWDYDSLANEWDNLDLVGWGVPAWETPNEDGPIPPVDELENPYSTKMEAPIYEIRGEQPDESELVDTGKVDELLEHIEAADVPERVKAFLRVCAYRHAVIDFENMAEYYAHAPKEVQELMEENALVIIDFDKAVENGFVRMSKDLDAIYAKNKEILYGTE